MIRQYKVVVDKHDVQQSQRHIYFQHRKDGDEDRQGFYMTRRDWDEMGQPTQVTITVEPGDLIPEESTHRRNLLDKVPHRAVGIPNRLTGEDPRPHPVIPTVVPGEQA